MRIAEADIIRAQQRCVAEKARGLSLGAREGRTVELVEAEAVLDVSEGMRVCMQPTGTLTSFFDTVSTTRIL